MAKVVAVDGDAPPGDSGGSTTGRRSSGGLKEGATQPKADASVSAEGGRGSNADEQGRIAKAVDLWALGITIVIGGQYFSWNPGLAAGVGSYLIAVMLTAIGYITLVCSVAEMASTLPFAGGAFGYSRVTHGTYVGYLVGTSESAEYMMYVATTVLCFGQMVTDLTHLPVAMEPLWWLVFYVTSLALHIIGGKPFWAANRWLAIAITAALVSFPLVTIPNMDFLANVKRAYGATDTDVWFVGGFPMFMRQFSLASWFFIGVEAIPMACQDAVDPRASVPRGMVSCVATLFVTCVATFFSTIANGPDIDSVASTLLPLNEGFGKILRVRERDVHLLNLITLPAVWATGFGFIFAYGRQIYAMAGSGLLPKFLLRGSPSRPHAAFITGSVIAVIAQLISWNRPAVVVLVFQVCVIAAFLTYICQLVSFIKLRTVFTSLDRKYQSPLGVVGAYVGIAIFTLGLVAVVFFEHGGIPLAIVFAYMLLASVYYFAYARHRQVFSKEETKAMFNAYIVKANVNKLRTGNNANIGNSSPRGTPRTSTGPKPTAGARTNGTKLLRVDSGGRGLGIAALFRTTRIQDIPSGVRRTISGPDLVERLTACCPLKGTCWLTRWTCLTATSRSRESSDAVQAATPATIAAACGNKGAGQSSPPDHAIDVVSGMRSSREEVLAQLTGGDCVGCGDVGDEDARRSDGGRGERPCVCPPDGLQRTQKLPPSTPKFPSRQSSVPVLPLPGPTPTDTSHTQQQQTHITDTRQQLCGSHKLDGGQHGAVNCSAWPPTVATGAGDVDTCDRPSQDTAVQPAVCGVSSDDAVVPFVALADSPRSA